MDFEPPVAAVMKAGLAAVVVNLQPGPSLRGPSQAGEIGRVATTLSHGQPSRSSNATDRLTEKSTRTWVSFEGSNRCRTQGPRRVAAPTTHQCRSPDRGRACVALSQLILGEVPRTSSPLSPQESVRIQAAPEGLWTGSRRVATGSLSRAGRGRRLARRCEERPYWLALLRGRRGICQQSQRRSLRGRGVPNLALSSP